jgi:site-specific recombinase
VALAASPFFLLPRLCDALFSGIGSVASCREQLAACREVLDAVLAHLEEFGVSVDVVYRIEVIGIGLDRMGELLAVLEAAGDEARATAAIAFLAHLLSARARDRSLRDLARTNLHLMARKIIEHAGQTGEHYITATRREYWGMLASAAGGGVLTAGTAAIKWAVMWGGFPLFVEGAFASANYAVSFLLMQLCGFTLATKQPSMTAAALARSLHESRDEPNLDELVTVITRICRSQLAAVIGNISFVVPAVIGLDFLYRRWAGHPFLDGEAAEHTLASFHPTHSGTIYFAALTGVILWLSSIGAGWLENWVTYRRLPEAIAQKRPQWLTRRLSRFVAHHTAGFGGNVSLGVLLGMVPVIGKFLGVPADVRHVTLSTGGLALAASALGRGILSHPGFPGAVIGIGVILVGNFGVSFALALGVALRARGVEHAGLRLLRALASRFVRSPGEFFFPPRA